MEGKTINKLSKKSIKQGVGFALVLVCTIGFISLKRMKVKAATKSTPVAYYGKMQASGNRIIGSKTNAPIQVTGMSFFWSNWSDTFYNEATVNRMVDEFQVEIVRASYGVQDGGVPHAGTHKSELRNKGNIALNAGIPLFVTEWGSVNADGNGGRDEASTMEWVSWMNENKISSCNWSIFDKAESSSIYQPNSGINGDLSDTGIFIKNLIINQTKNAPWR